MNILKEGLLEINFTDAVNAFKFDQNDPNQSDYHDIGSMPRVDFVVETENDIYFIELKDPGRPDAVDPGSTKLLKKIENGTLEASLIEKYLFTFFFRWAENKLNKSVHYFCLITLDSPELQPIGERLEKRLEHFSKKSSRWVRRPLCNFQICNLETWNAIFPNWPAKRLSSTLIGS